MYLIPYSHFLNVITIRPKHFNYLLSPHMYTIVFSESIRSVLYIVHALFILFINFFATDRSFALLNLAMGKRKFDFSPFGTCNFSPIALVGNYQILILLFTSKKYVISNKNITKLWINY